VVVHTGGIGDFLLACPAIQRLAEEGPVEIAGHRDRGELAVAAGIAEAAHDLDRIGFSSLFTEPSTALRTFLRRFQRAVVWLRDGDGAMSSTLRRCGLEDVRCFPGLPPADWNGHASEYYLDCLASPPTPPFRLGLSPSPGSLDVIIHPGSGGRRKNWPMVHFEQAAKALAAQGRRVNWCTGPAEEGCVLPESAVQCACDSLVDLARTLAGARLYLGNDSGITHLAAASGCPCIAVFGPTDPTVWAPLGDNVWVHQPQDFAAHGHRERSHLRGGNRSTTSVSRGKPA